jgi:dTDP-4-dehydrorhamnose 3,5-epimerase
MMQIEETPLPCVRLITPTVYRDARGFFMESYRRDALLEAGIDDDFVQDNHSRSVYRTLRGLHFQLPPAGQSKLVRVVQGTIWDVAVDIRVGSPTFGRWFGAELSAENCQELYIPVGFAHGFCVLSPSADVLYKAGHVYSRDHEKGILWCDPTLAIPWPIAAPTLSARDEAAPPLSAYLEGAHFSWSAAI